MKLKPAPIRYVEIPAPDMEKAETFYGTVFGWKMEPSRLSDQKYTMFSTGEGELTGGLDSSRSAMDGGPVLYLQVEDIDTSLESIRRAGGAILRAREDIGGAYGFSAMFRDPNGNVLGLWQPR